MFYIFSIKVVKLVQKMDDEVLKLLICSEQAKSDEQAGCDIIALPSLKSP